MTRESTIFRFDPSVSMFEVDSTLHLARVAASSLHGEDRIRQQAEARVDVENSSCRIDTTREAGQSLALIFGGYVRQEFGEKAVRVQRIASTTKTPHQEIPT